MPTTQISFVFEGLFLIEQYRNSKIFQRGVDSASDSYLLVEWPWTGKFLHLQMENNTYIISFLFKLMYLIFKDLFEF